MFPEPLSFLIGAALNLLVVLFIVRFIYFPGSQDKNFVFSFIAFSAIIYFVLQFLTSTELSIGFGFGLFAIFSILRYRTAELPIREMTYLFTVIGLAVMNSFVTSSGALIEMGIANVVVIALLYVLEREWGFRFESSKRLVYDKIDLITPDHRSQLIDDLRVRTGLAVTRVEIDRIDFLRDTAELKVFYDEPATVKKANPALPEATPLKFNHLEESTLLRSQS